MKIVVAAISGEVTKETEKFILFPSLTLLPLFFPVQILLLRGLCVSVVILCIE
jgi:hypothetical protein